MSETLHATRFPGESDEYRRERDRLLEHEVQLRRDIEAVAAERRALPLGGEVPVDYAFDPFRMSELFAPGKDTLLLYSFMFLPANGDPLGVACPSCTSIVDSLDGAAPHIEQRVNLAVVAKVPLEQFQAHARTRGWRNVRLLSSAGTTYHRDYHTESPDTGGQLPVATIFVRRDGTIRHSWSSELMYAPRDPDMHPRHVDFMWPIWSVFDLTPEGRGTDWNPQLDYS